MAYNEGQSAASKGLSSGVRWGVIGAAIGFLALPAAGFFLAGGGLLGIGLAAVGLLIAPITTTMIGGIIGATVGGSVGHGVQAGRNARSMNAMVKENAYMQTMQALQEQTMAATQPQVSSTFNQASSTIDAASAQAMADRVAPAPDQHVGQGA